MKKTMIFTMFGLLITTSLIYCKENVNKVKEARPAATPSSQPTQIEMKTDKSPESPEEQPLIPWVLIRQR